jgi:hypothetical protein
MPAEKMSRYGGSSRGAAPVLTGKEVFQRTFLNGRKNTAFRLNILQIFRNFFC